MQASCDVGTFLMGNKGLAQAAEQEMPLAFNLPRGLVSGLYLQGLVASTLSTISSALSSFLKADHAEKGNQCFAQIQWRSLLLVGRLNNQARGKKTKQYFPTLHQKTPQQQNNKEDSPKNVQLLA